MRMKVEIVAEVIIVVLKEIEEGEEEEEGIHPVQVPDDRTTIVHLKDATDHHLIERIVVDLLVAVGARIIIIIGEVRTFQRHGRRITRRSWWME